MHYKSVIFDCKSYTFSFVSKLSNVYKSKLKLIYIYWAFENGVFWSNYQTSGRLTGSFYPPEYIFLLKKYTCITELSYFPNSNTTQKIVGTKCSNNGKASLKPNWTSYLWIKTEKECWLVIPTRLLNTYKKFFQLDGMAYFSISLGTAINDAKMRKWSKRMANSL